MRILGYTDDRELVAIDLSIEEIIAHRIDPWRLDLHDPSPIRLERAHGAVNFRALQNIAFEYVHDADRDKIVVGIFDQNGKMCVICDQKTGAFNPQGVTVTSDESFEHHFREFLAYAEHDILSPVPATGIVLNPAYGLQVRNDSTALAAYEPCYEGEMLEVDTHAIQLPEEINFVFRRFAQWNPVISHRCLVEALRGKPVTLVDFYLDPGGAHEVARLLEEQTGRKFSDLSFSPYLKFGSCGYSPQFVSPPNTSDRLKWFQQDAAGIYSIRCFFSAGENRVTGLRIAFHDLAHTQTRLLFCPKILHSTGTGEQRRDCELRGFKIVDGSALLKASAVSA